MTTHKVPSHSRLLLVASGLLVSTGASGCVTPPATTTDAGSIQHDDGSTVAKDVVGSDSDSSAPIRPNVLILLTDDQRYDTVHALGNQMIQTPNMDRLVRAGTSFSQATCLGGINGALCMTSRAALMTGRTINHLNVAGDISPDQTTLPELLRQAGYVTFATGKWHNDMPSHTRIFDQADNIFFGGMHFPEDGGHEHPLLYHFDPTGAYPVEARFVGDKFSSVMYADAAIEFLETVPQDGRPFFAYVAFTAPHDPRTPPPPFDTMYDASQTPLPDNFLPEHPFDNGDLHNRDESLLDIPRDPALVRKEIAAYYGMISEVDSEIGRILDTLEQQGLFDNTIIVFAGDNGLALGAHGLLGKQNLYEESMRIPMIFVGPGIAANVVTEQFAQLPDIMPTVAALLGIDPPASSEGSALLGAHATAFSRATAYFQYTNLHRGIRTTDHWKLIGYRLTVPGPQFDRVQLFDLNADPKEVNDLSMVDAYQTKLSGLQSLLDSERARHDDPLLK
jgi:arylsulfatase A-like enzyme